MPFRASHWTAASRQTMISLTPILTRAHGAINNYQYSSQWKVVEVNTAYLQFLITHTFTH